MEKGCRNRYSDNTPITYYTTQLTMIIAAFLPGGKEPAEGCPENKMGRGPLIWQKARGPAEVMLSNYYANFAQVKSDGGKREISPPSMVGLFACRRIAADRNKFDTGNQKP
jgi:hypothetical protein